jgi:hypothetical protein
LPYGGIDLLLSALAFAIYGGICLISLIFTFAIGLYMRIDERLNEYFLVSRFTTPLEIEIDFFDRWLVNHHRPIGLVLVFLSLFDMQLCFLLIRHL